MRFLNSASMLTCPSMALAAGVCKSDLSYGARVASSQCERNHSRVTFVLLLLAGWAICSITNVVLKLV